MFFATIILSDGFLFFYFFVTYVLSHNKNRKRNRILNFRVSEEEYDLINKKISISGLKKRDYFLQMLLNHEVKLVSDYRLSDNIAKEIFQLAKVIKKFGKLNDDEADILIYILEIYEEIKKSPYYKK